MTKREFLDRLERCLAGLEDGERASTVEFYREQIEDRIDDGMSEEEAVASLEKPEDIAASILSQRAESQERPTAPTGTNEPVRPARRHPVLRGIGIAVLGFLAVLAAIVLLPVAVGLAGTVVFAYLSLWMADVVLVAGAFACVAASVLIAVTCFVAPVGSAAVMTATVALVVGLAALAVLLAVGSYFFGKLLVMLVVWPVRALRRRADRKRAGTAPSSAAQPKRDYPSMPMPPTVDASAQGQPARGRRGLPIWGAFTIGAAILALAALLTGFGVLAAVGGPEPLLEEAGISDQMPVLRIDADGVDTIDLTVPAESAQDVRKVVVGISPDEQIHVIGWCGGVTGTLYWGSSVGAQGSLDGSTVTLVPIERRTWSVQNPFTSLNTAYRYSDDARVTVLVPQDWKGDIVCNAQESPLEVRIDRRTLQSDGGVYYFAGDDPLRIDGDVDLRAGSVDLDSLTAGSVSVEATSVGIYDVRADSLSVNAEADHGRAEVYRTEVAGTVELGGGQVIVDGLSAESVETDASTRIVEEKPVEEAGAPAARDVQEEQEG